MAKEKLGEISLIEAGNEANNELLASFPTKSSGISTIFTRHPTRAKVSFNHLAAKTGDSWKITSASIMNQLVHGRNLVNVN